MKESQPTSPGKRHTKLSENEGVSAGKPKKSLTSGTSKSGGRGNTGKITTRHRGGGHKRRSRSIDLSLIDKAGISAVVEDIQYDPNRSGHIALLLFADGERRYTLAAEGMESGDSIAVGPEAGPKTGNRLPLKNISVGTDIYNVALKPGEPGKLARSAGSSIQVSAQGDQYTTVKMPSGEIRKIPKEAYASVGSVSNPEHGRRELGKAGRARWLGQRPEVRGKVMNPVDHPHAGGEAHRTRGTRREKTNKGRPAGKGQKTRKSKKYSDKLIVKRRSS
ncbi:MAG: 50S ribosomal protein L2 [Parcubacteria group bacterium SW_6_46_9]|nr:MAG: 50S ribosomal protein L2 [Parcubacteria group bacterium SW_6_46_9]